MQRKEFLKNFSLGAMVVPFLQSCSTDEALKDESSGDGNNPNGNSSDSCSVTDTETDGPYPLYNSRGSAINRVDITDGKEGIPLNMIITIKDVNANCAG